MTSRDFYSRWFYLIISVGISGCGAPGIYYWGDYEQGIYERYVSEQQPQADAYLLQTITDAEQNHLKVPPGAYADYGFVLFKRGDRDGAVAYFEREKQAFPESSTLMSKLIERVKQNKAALAEKSPEQAVAADGGKP